MAGAVQWGVDQLFAFLSKIQTGAAAERARASMNNAALIDLNAQGKSIADPKVRATWDAWIKTSVARQGVIAGVYRSLSSRFASLAAQVKAWLVSVGLSPSVPGLSGLGFAQAVVPIAIVALALIAWAAVAWMQQANKAQVDAIAFHREALSALVKKGASAAQLAAFAADTDKTIEKAMPKGDPFDDLMKQVSSLLGIGATVFFGVYILKQLRKSRRGRARVAA